MISRPYPSDELFQLASVFKPAPDVELWMRDAYLKPESSLYNVEHDHLNSARIGVLWTNVELKIKGGKKDAIALMPDAQGSKVDKALREVQMIQWFGMMPHFLIILDAWAAKVASDRRFCLVANHELTHCGHAKDGFGCPKFDKETGQPKFAMRPHDHEYFDSDVRLFGAREALGDEAVKIIFKADKEPEFSDIEIAKVCGTCALMR